MSPQLFLILIDALRHDFIDPAHSPFLASLLPRADHATIIESVSFQTRPVFFAGLEPDQSDICHLYQYDPATSPFSFLKPFTALLPLLPQKITRRIINRLAKIVERSHGHLASAAVLGSGTIPLPLLPYFAPSERVFTDDPEAFAPQLSIFDMMRARGLRWNWVGYPRHFGSTVNILNAYHALPEAEVAYLHFSELDWIGHRFGPNSLEMHAAQTSLDETLKNLLQPALHAGASVVIFGDHGMVEVTQKIDLRALIEQLGFAPGRDYLMFLDSTQARFWFFSERARTEIIKVLEKIPQGHILGAEELKNLHLAFTHRRYGDLIFALDGGIVIHPSYFESITAPRGMHGYLPSVHDNKTQILAVGPHITARERGTLAMPAMYEIMKEVLESTIGKM
jgi:predicted AlkP superfamily pyrophosphatase or phosphodiesterase